MQKKTNFENESGNAILERASKLNKIVSYDDTIVSQKFVPNQASSFVPRLDFALFFFRKQLFTDAHLGDGFCFSLNKELAICPQTRFGTAFSFRK